MMKIGANSENLFFLVYFFHEFSKHKKRYSKMFFVGYLHQKKIIFAKTKENPQRSYRVIHQVREEHMLALSCIVVQCAVTKTKIIFSSKQKFFSVLMNNPVDLIYR